MRAVYSKELDRLNSEILDYGYMASSILEMSINSLIKQDMKLAEEVKVLEDKMDVIEIDLESKCLDVLILQQPMARDLRLVLSIIKMISDIERIGDLCENIAEAAIDIGHQPLIKPLIDIPKMADVCQVMLKKALESYVNGDVQGAKEVFEMDDRVDDLFKTVTNDVLHLIHKDEKCISQGMQFILISRYLERIADHTTNICESINYISTGNRMFNIQ